MDFLILYDSEQREIDSDLLIKAELERRGYSCCLCKNNYKILRLFYRPKVVAMFGCYGQFSEYMMYQASHFLFKHDVKLVNFAWEQVPTMNDSFILPVGKGTEINHFCWGKHYKSILKEGGVDEQKLPVVGSAKMDFLTPDFDTYFKSKDQIAKEYHLRNEKRWVLFNGDFAKRSLGEKRLRSELTDFPEYKVNKAIWWKGYEDSVYYDVVYCLDRLTRTHPEIEVIYRPHPAEFGDKNVELKELEIKYANFHIIRDYSAQQWIKVVDKVIVWISTTAIDSYFANKDCFSFESENGERYRGNEQIALFIDKSKMLRNYEQMEAAILKDYEELSTPLDLKYAFSFYDNVCDKHAYIKICDCLEQIIKDKKDQGSDIELPYEYRENYKNVIKNSLKLSVIYNHIKEMIKNKFMYRKQKSVLKKIVSNIAKEYN